MAAMGWDIQLFCPRAGNPKNRHNRQALPRVFEGMFKFPKKKAAKGIRVTMNVPCVSVMLRSTRHRSLGVDSRGYCWFW